MCSLIHKVRNIFVRGSLRIHAANYNHASSRTLARMLSDPENKGERQEHINFDILGTWDNRIDLPILMQQSIKLGKPIPQISIKNVGVASVTGRRLTNEDRLCIKELQPNLLYFAVFDGHGGTTCADFCSQHMEQHILHWLSRNSMDLESVLQKAFIEVNNAFARNVIFMCSKEEAAVSGTTATICLLRNSIELVVGHVGDSRALLCRNGDVQKLTVDHHGTLKSEKERIVKSGGFIKTDSVGRHLVNGRLAMTRSLGDMDLKPYGVTALPDTRSIQIKHGKDAFVILTTDGINFVMNDDEIINAVNSCHYPQEAASFIADQAMQFASEDNATALVLPFGAWGKYKNGGNITMYNFGRNLSRSSRF
ncbi:protein phosphatase 1K, mitochondrial-like [Limulus polyphemus]|uniref:Protein phosphatase 1K, mitochondrial-like n=1 Tax=Limulus polyphemus TaxID=6850 RepID=A0ABM1SUS7_LIMPO|nr:protein phosphatase 1K, mitochondrial-like [Limulus polyphemus]XP_013779591.1 protein phosphatase 1K, mitochondrial-like [Limulus polyphemus]XP_022247383.1 protein phosphatase 1K, mitochondrial-like [Limulus polyphemus]XP_022247384.1 protein phosphatase 1K, mitochondrial-like [Limulus polyphemus]